MFPSVRALPISAKPRIMETTPLWVTKCPSVTSLLPAPRVLDSSSSCDTSISVYPCLPWRFWCQVWPKDLDTSPFPSALSRTSMQPIPLSELTCPRRRKWTLRFPPYNSPQTSLSQSKRKWRAANLCSCISVQASREQMAFSPVYTQETELQGRCTLATLSRNLYPSLGSRAGQASKS